jgi:hypothetical protein
MISADDVFHRRGGRERVRARALQVEVNMGIGEAVFDALGKLERKRGLANTAESMHPGDGHALAEFGEQFVQLPLTSGEIGRGRRELMLPIGF